ncbi:hypothetical protein BJ166DRAFT_542299 [Pestalotiopsis sp. NC0098]|nr:hypothetical protein BJ166DRAFT_542299 [Pestalotiopsis sp. NC0098]
MSVPQAQESPDRMDISSGSDGESSDRIHEGWQITDDEWGKEELVEQTMNHRIGIQGEGTAWIYNQIVLKSDRKPIFRYAAEPDRGAISVRAGDAVEDEKTFSLDLTESTEFKLSKALFQAYERTIKGKSDLRWVTFSNITNETVRHRIDLGLTSKLDVNEERSKTFRPDDFESSIYGNPYFQSVQKLVEKLRKGASIAKVTPSDRPVKGGSDQDLVFRIRYPGEPESGPSEDSAGSSDSIVMGEEWYGVDEDEEKKEE